ncbi:MAG: hypothetical protein HY420_01265 [Candidatus Kerfeldbacteria bacterium]|nr:hypothetical protein [Candidatus Kerfeldbacteria bacterium]
MSAKEIKKICLLVTGALLVVAFTFAAQAADFSSSGFTVKDPVITAGLLTASSTNFGLGQSLTQTAIGKSTSTSYQLWSGFQYYFKVNAHTLTAAAGDGQASLSWTVPVTFLGASVGGYEVGTGTVSGSYTFESVGNVTSYTKSGLSNGTAYYFIIKAKTAAGTFLVFSNEATATPTGAAASPAPPGTSGPTVQQGKLVVSGLTSPQANVVLLKDGAIAVTGTADNSGAFSLTLTGVTSGTHNFNVYANDRSGVKTASFNFSRSFSTGLTVTVDNIFLAPTLRLSHSIIRKGDALGVTGFTVPGAEVVIYLAGSQVGRPVSDQAGFYSFSLATVQLELRRYGVQSRGMRGSLSSAFSDTKEFEVSRDRSVPVPEGQSGRSDLNSDGRVDLIDFSILLYWWQQEVAEEIEADINKSGRVDFTDFSIMLYDWTG